jgi:hypothetical protein
MTSKHGDFFRPFESAPEVGAPPLSVFLTGCKGNLCPEVFGLVVQFLTQVTNSRTENYGGFEAAVSVGQAGCLSHRSEDGIGRETQRDLPVGIGQAFEHMRKGDFTAVNPRTARIFSFFCTRVSCVCLTSTQHEPYYYQLQPVHGE